MFVRRVYNKLFDLRRDGICSELFLSAVYSNVCVLSSIISSNVTKRSVVKESGLVCVSYGNENDDKVFVRKQIEAGVDAVIVDSVLAIRNELTSGGFQNVKAKGAGV